MSVTDEFVVADGADLVDDRAPLSRRRQRRALGVYLAFAAVGLALAVVGSPGWQAFGTGLWWPGAGFVVDGSWTAVLAPVTLVLFALSLVAWFGAGASTLPVAVWILSAGGAGLLTSETWTPGVVIAAAVTVLIAVAGTVAARVSRRKALALRAERAAYLPEELAELQTITRAPATHRPEDRELSPTELAALRYPLQCALQPVGQLEGFDRIDQFQTASLRYQLNHAGYTLAVAQRQYTPSFHGYLSEAQRRLIEQYLQKRIWSYWRWENAWGNLSLNADPAAKDNIMLTGYITINLCHYMASTGDMRYAQPGSLPFALNERTVFHHDVHTMVASLMDNFRRSAFCLFPCEPNWMYPACNFRGITSLAAYDALFGTAHVEEVRDAFESRLRSEFIGSDGGIVALRSALTGLPVPFPMPVAMMPIFLNPVFPELAEQYWAIARREMFEHSGGRPVKALVKKNAVDLGNYRPGYALEMESLVGAAREMGDDDYAQIAQEGIDELCEPVTDGGVLYYRKASNFANVTLPMDRIMRRDYWRDTILKPAAAATLSGPILDEHNYPEVLVAKATSEGADLDLVLYPGGQAGPRTIAVSRLRPGARYRVEGGRSDSVTADAHGAASVDIHLDERTAVRLTPCL